MRILGVAVGGTFTDAVLVEDGRVTTAKVPTARQQEESVVAAADAVGARDVERFTHGTTIATNALLERKGARTAFVATEGFEHLLHLRRQTRAHLYRLCERHPEPLVPIERCYGVRERIAPDRVLRPLELDSLPSFDAEAVAICLLHAYGDPRHEQQLAAEPGLPEPLVMASSGGVAALAEAAAHPARALISGPAAGAVGAARVAALAGVTDAIAFDMGGTSTDVCLISAGSVGRSPERAVAGLPIRLPTGAVPSASGRKAQERSPARPVTGEAGRARPLRMRTCSSAACRGDCPEVSSSTSRRRSARSRVWIRPTSSRPSTPRCCAHCVSSPSSG